MNKKKLLIFLAAVVAVALVAVAVIVIAALTNTPGPGGPGDTPSPKDNSELAARFGEFSSVSVTIGEDPKTTANVTWQSLETGRSGYVKFYEKNAGSAGAVKATADAFDNVFEVPVSGQFELKVPQLESVKGQIHRCYLTGLKPDTEYVFTVGYEGGAESAEMAFTTASSSESFSFILVADTQGFTKRNFDVWETLAKLAAEKCPDADFVIHMGDAVEEGKNHNQWQLFFNASSALFNGRPVIDVAGNRDKKHTLLRYTNGSRENRTALVSGYYSFDWGNVHFAVLNTGDGEKDIPKSQMKWLEADLEASTAKTKVILMHKAPYTNANHFNDPEIVAMRAQILPVAEKYGVAAVISGHDHYYFRSKPVTGEGLEAACERTEITYSGTKIEMLRSPGTVYFVNGSAGVKQHDNPISTASDIIGDVSMLTKGPSFSYVTVDNEKMVVLTYVNESGSLRVLDAFGIYFD